MSLLYHHTINTSKSLSQLDQHCTMATSKAWLASKKEYIFLRVSCSFLCYYSIYTCIILHHLMIRMYRDPPFSQHYNNLTLLWSTPFSQSHNATHILPGLEKKTGLATLIKSTETKPLTASHIHDPSPYKAQSHKATASLHGVEMTPIYYPCLPLFWLVVVHSLS